MNEWMDGPCSDFQLNVTNDWQPEVKHYKSSACRYPCIVCFCILVWSQNTHVAIWETMVKQQMIPSVSAIFATFRLSQHFLFFFCSAFLQSCCCFLLLVLANSLYSVSCRILRSLMLTELTVCYICHLLLFMCLSRTRLWGQQSQQGSPDHAVPSHLQDLLWRILRHSQVRWEVWSLQHKTSLPDAWTTTEKHQFRAPCSCLNSSYLSHWAQPHYTLPLFAILFFQ